MGTTVAFLRGINVAGHKMTAMPDVVRIFESLGFANVRTYIQSGNVLFDTRARSLGRLRLKIERALHDELGAEVTVLLRALSEVVGIVERDPFKKNRVLRAKPFVTFMSEPPGETPALPLRSRKGDVEVFEIVGTEAFSLSIEKNGRFGFPNSFIEKEFGVPATTRNWNTVCKVAALARVGVGN